MDICFVYFKNLFTIWNIISHWLSYYISSLLSAVCFPKFQLATSRAVRKYYRENFRTKQFISFKLLPLWVSWWNVMLSCSSPPGTWIIHLPSTSMLHTLPTCSSRGSRLSYGSAVTGPQRLCPVNPCFTS